MDKSDETIEKILAEQPIKPNLDEFGLDEAQVEELATFKSLCERKSKIYLILFFGIITGSSVFVIVLFSNSYGFIFLSALASAIFVWGILPLLIKLISKKELKDLVFHYKSTIDQSVIEKNYLSFNQALDEYKKKNYIFERAIGRMTNNYWLSLNPQAFEDAVAELFAENGWDVYTTPVTRDHGVDLFIEKDGVTAVVQCKTYKKVLGPNAARDLYGTMVAQNVSHAYLAAPGGFSYATKEFCKGKPITLLDIDELSKMFYPFEDYTPHWIDSAKSMEDIQKGIRKHIYGRQQRKNKYYY